MNYKGFLNEYFQKRKVSLPQYETKQIKNTEHNPLFISSITLYDGTIEVGEICPKAKAAESSAAYIIIKKLSLLASYDCKILDESKFSQENHKKEISNGPKIQTTDHNRNVISDKILTDRICVLIDLENLQKFPDDITDDEILNKNLTIYVFVGKHHCLADKKLSNGIIRIISPSTRPNGTDTCIQVYTGMLLVKEYYDLYLIATRDNFGSTLAEMIGDPNLGWTPKKAYQITKISQIYEYI